MTWIAIRQLLGGHWLIVGLASAAFVSLIGWDSSRKAQWLQKGSELVRVETKKANDAAVSTADRIRARAQSRSVRGQRDPNSID